jgi:hypothetical protein
MVRAPSLGTPQASAASSTNTAWPHETELMHPTGTVQANNSTGRSELGVRRSQAAESECPAMNADSAPEMVRTGDGSGPSEGFPRFVCSGNVLVFAVGDDSLVQCPRGVHGVDVARV